MSDSIFTNRISGVSIPKDFLLWQCNFYIAKQFRDRAVLKGINCLTFGIILMTHIRFVRLHLRSRPCNIYDIWTSKYNIKSYFTILGLADSNLFCSAYHIAFQGNFSQLQGVVTSQKKQLSDTTLDKLSWNHPVFVNKRSNDLHSTPCQ